MSYSRASKVINCALASQKHCEPYSKQQFQKRLTRIKRALNQSPEQVERTADTDDEVMEYNRASPDLWIREANVSGYAVTFPLLFHMRAYTTPSIARSG